MKITRRTLGVAAIILAIAGVAAFGIYFRMAAAAEESPQEGRASAGAFDDGATGTGTDVSIPVGGVPVMQDTLVLSVDAAGEAAAGRQAFVTAQVSGRVAAVRVRENDGVGGKTVVIVIDPAEYQLQLREAEANLRRAEASYRELTLFDDRIEDAKVRSEREGVARAKSGLDASRVQLERARVNLSRTRVQAPFAGRVASVKVVEGQWVQAGQELMTVVQLDPMRVEVQVLESDIGQLNAGRAAKVSFAAYPGEPFAGRIETINPMVDQKTRTARVTVSLHNPDGRILPGMYARVSLDARSYPDRILVPRAAILERDRRSMLFVHEDGRAKWRYVTTGMANSHVVEIVENPETEMVSAGEVVLVDGHHTLVHDARIRLVDDVAAAGGRPR